MSIWSRLKQAAQGVITNQMTGFALYGQTDSKYAYDPEQARQNAVVGALVRWLTNAVLQAPLKLYTDESREVEIDNHPFLDVMRQPMRGITYQRLMRQTVRGMLIYGAGYWLPLSDRPNATMPSGLQYVSHKNLSPYQDREGQRTAGSPLTPRVYRTENGVPLPNLKPLLYQIAEGTEDEPESPFAAAGIFVQLDPMIAKSAYGRLSAPVVGVVLRARDNSVISKTQRESVEAELARLRQGGSGGPFLVQGNYDVSELQGSYQRTDWTGYYNVDEERICAQVQVSPAVVQLGTGLQSTQVGATIAEEIRMAWVNGAFPLIEVIQEEIQGQILPLFAPPESGLQVVLDTSNIDYEPASYRQLRTDRLIAQVDAKFRTRESAALEDGIPQDDIPEDEPEPEPQQVPPQLAPFQPNGNGQQQQPIPAGGQNGNSPVPSRN